MEMAAIKGVNVGFYDGQAIAVEADVNDIIGSTYGLEVDLVAIPVERLVD